MELKKTYSVYGIVEIDKTPINVSYQYINDDIPTTIELMVYQSDYVSVAMIYEDKVLTIKNIEDNHLTDDFLEKIKTYCDYVIENFNKI